LYTPQSAIVFIPPYEVLEEAIKKSSASAETILSYIRIVLGDNVLQYKQNLLEYIMKEDKKVRIVVEEDGKYRILNTNKDILEAKSQKNKLFLSFGTDNETDFTIPVTNIPKIDYYPYDTTLSKGDDGLFYRERHMGHKIIKIPTEQPKMSDRNKILPPLKNPMLN